MEEIAVYVCGNNEVLSSGHPALERLSSDQQEEYTAPAVALAMDYIEDEISLDADLNESFQVGTDYRFSDWRGGQQGNIRTTSCYAYCHESDKARLTAILDAADVILATELERQAGLAAKDAIPPPRPLAEITRDLMDYLKESHQAELESRHGEDADHEGPAPEACSYCQIIAEAEAALEARANA